MEISCINNNSTSFRKLYTGESSKVKLRSRNCPKQIVNKFVRTRFVIRKAGINKLKNIDIILDYNEYRSKFEAVIYSIKGLMAKETTESPVFSGIVNTEKCIEELKKWGQYWNNKCAKL